MLLSHWSIAPFCVDDTFYTLLGRRVCHNRVRSHFVVPSFWKEGSTGSDFSSIILILTHPRTACECPSSDFCLRTPVFFCPDCQRMPRSFFFGQTRGSAPTVG